MTYVFDFLLSTFLLHCVLYPISASYLDSMRTPHDLLGYRSKHMSTHLKAYPEASQQFYAKDSMFDIFSFEKWWFQKQQLCWDCSKSMHGSVSAETVAARLWEVTEQLINDWEGGRPILMNPILTSSSEF